MANITDYATFAGRYNNYYNKVRSFFINLHHPLISAKHNLIFIIKCGLFYY
jgi:hypothetical protein